MKTRFAILLAALCLLLFGCGTAPSGNAGSPAEPPAARTAPPEEAAAFPAEPPIVFSQEDYAGFA